MCRLDMMQDIYFRTRSTMDLMGIQLHRYMWSYQRKLDQGTIYRIVLYRYLHKTIALGDI